MFTKFFDFSQKLQAKYGKCLDIINLIQCSSPCQEAGAAPLPARASSYLYGIACAIGDLSIRRRGSCCRMSTV